MKLSKKTQEKIMKPSFKSSKAIDLLIYMAQFQDERGLVVGINYKDVFEYAGLKRSAFYYSLKYLEKYGIISIMHEDCELVDYGSYAIKILDNDFSSGYANYLNINRDIFYSKKFIALPIATKKFIIKYLSWASIGKNYSRPLTFEAIARWLNSPLRSVRKVIKKASSGLLKIEIILGYKIKISNLAELLQNRNCSEANIRCEHIAKHYIKLFRAELPIAKDSFEYADYLKWQNFYKEKEKKGQESNYKHLLYDELYENENNALKFIGNILKKCALDIKSIKKAVRVTIASNPNGILSPRKLSFITKTATHIS